jgi:hypothetical protein
MVMSQSTSDDGSGVWGHIVRRAVEDPDFRESLLSDPRSTVEQATGSEIPADLEIVVVENTPTKFHLVLPSEDIDLEELDASGGIMCNHMCGPDNPGTQIPSIC